MIYIQVRCTYMFSRERNNMTQHNTIWHNTTQPPYNTHDIQRHDNNTMTGNANNNDDLIPSHPTPSHPIPCDPKNRD